MSKKVPYFVLTGQVESMLREPKLQVFCSPPEYDLKLSTDLERNPDEGEAPQPWPDTELVFGSDEEYQEIVSDVLALVNHILTDVENYKVVSGELETANKGEQLIRERDV